MEPSRLTVSCHRVAAARGSFGNAEAPLAAPGNQVLTTALTIDGGFGRIWAEQAADRNLTLRVQRRGATAGTERPAIRRSDAHQTSSRRD